MSEKEKEKQNANYEEKIQDTENCDVTNEDENDSSHMTEEEFSEQYRKLPTWQHVLLVMLFLFGMAAIIIGIDFIVDFFTELIKHII
jgi:uncharacterized membrane protein YcjF (UPF0283 family)